MVRDLTVDRGLADPRVLCAALGHELRNPLAAALASLQVGEAMTDEADPRAPFLHQAQIELDRLRRSLDGLLCLGSGRPLGGATVDLGRCVRDVFERQRDPRVVLGALVEGASVPGHPALIERALENLVDNALKAGPTSVEITLRRTTHGFEIEVLDDGRGLPEGLGAQMFEPFESGSGSTGLGLAVVRSTMEAHGGEIHLVDRVDRSGVRATLEFPETAEATELWAG